MLLLGPLETLQLVDRSEKLPVMRYLATSDEIVAVSAPALAAVADAYASEPEKKRFGLMNRLEGFLRQCADSTAPGLGETSPIFMLIPLSRSAVMSFSKIRQVIGVDEDLYLVQTFAVAHGEDVTLLLIATEQVRGHIANLCNAGIDLSVRWIEPDSEGE